MVTNPLSDERMDELRETLYDEFDGSPLYISVSEPNNSEYDYKVSFEESKSNSKSREVTCHIEWSAPAGTWEVTAIETS